MIDPEPILKARLRWVKHYEQSQNAALTCRRCGISKATLLKWRRRYQLHGEPAPRRAGDALTESPPSQTARAQSHHRARDPRLGHAPEAPSWAQGTPARVVASLWSAFFDSHDLEDIALPRRLSAQTFSASPRIQTLHASRPRGSGANRYLQSGKASLSIHRHR